MTAPDFVWVDFFDEPTSSWCGDAFSTDSGDTEYVRRDPAVLAALPEVKAMVAAAAMEVAYRRTGVMDKDGREICVGDHVRILLNGKHTKEEYWFPEYEVIFKAPAFALRHIGGGKSSSTAHWYFDCPQPSSKIETIRALIPEVQP